MISNALKFSEEGKNVIINIDLNEDKTVISIKDEGPGFSEEEMNNLFKKFVKFAARPTAGESSTGLGLSIAKTLAGKLNGDIMCESIKGKGSTFYLVLPLYQRLTS